MHNNNNNNNNHYRRPSECTSPPPPSGSPSPSPSPSPTPTSTHPPLPPHRPRSSAQVPPETPQPRTQNTQSTHNPGPAHPRKPHPWFRLTIHYFATHLAPLVSCSTGQPHPDFPATMLSYHLLTSSQLDDLARHFHQVWPPSRETWEYPVAVLPWLARRRRAPWISRRRGAGSAGLSGYGGAGLLRRRGMRIVVLVVKAKVKRKKG
ncbi:hypothetical protein AOCH_003870 [Aspergillus ochraceoroseus]|uniref:Uncharacterized protein n=1 Tax=Aspergillus ochraceoroseus TaxID=138278 RepID=A0A0F8VFV9_9EURO|nr:hypothetical protein AOCH_003870 [Aspergillus ochraceoroseus]